MSYNPARQQGAVPSARRQRRLYPRAGVRHSDIIAKYGPAAAAIEDLRNRVNTSRGWRVVLFEGESFEMVYEYICAKNASGVVCHREKDRALRLMAGELYITIGQEVVHLRAGSSYAIPSGVEYQMSTSGTWDAELIFCQGPRYEESLEQISDPESVSIETNVSMVHPTDAPIREKVSNDAAKQYAAKLLEDRHQRDVARRQGISRVVDEQSVAATSGVEAVSPAPRRTPPRRLMAGQQQQGVNLRPMGAAGLGDDE